MKIATLFRIQRTLFLGFSILAASSAAGLSQALAKPEQLRYRWHRGETLIYRFTGNLPITSASAPFEYELVLKVRSVDAKGDATLDVKVRGYRVVPLPSLQSKGEGYHLDVDPTGRVTRLAASRGGSLRPRSASDWEEWLKTLCDPLSTPSAQRSVLGMPASDLVLRCLHWSLLPRDPIAPRATWESKVRTPIPGHQDALITFQGKLLSVRSKGGRSVADIDGKLVPPSGIPWSSRISFDMTHGRVISVQWAPPRDALEKDIITKLELVTATR